MHLPKIIPIAALVCLAGTVLAESGPRSPQRLVLIGDSTVKNGSGKGEGGLWGWGQVLGQHFDPAGVVVENRALGGRSSRTYRTEGLWARSLERLRPGDIVFMQFGHNDGGKMFEGDRPRASIKGNGDETKVGVVERTGKRETVHSYGWYLRQYIADAKAAGAEPVVLSPVPRDRWQDGKVLRASSDYGKWAREAAKQGGARFIDLNEIVARRYEAIGETEVGRDLFTDDDWTHTTKEGAELNSECVLEGIQALEGFALKKDIRTATSGGRIEDVGVVDGHLSVKLPLAEGNYWIEVETDSDTLTIKTELRRLMAPVRDGKSLRFLANVRRPQIAGGGNVSLKDRERGKEAEAWDENLSLELIGSGEVGSITATPAPRVPTIYLAGDSTVADQPAEPWASWGQMLPRFFKPTIAVANHAESGETVRNSLGARRFDKIFSLMVPGDFLFLQFGHNDMKDKREGALDLYRKNLTAIIDRARKLGATPVLVTSMERKAGVKAPTLGRYTDAVRAVAAEKEVSLIDLHAISIPLYRALGDDLGRAFVDGTHHSSYGAYLLAAAVTQGIRESDLPISKEIRPEAHAFSANKPLGFDDFKVPASAKRDPDAPEGS